VEDYGDYLFNLRSMRLRDPARAEDLVQETFLAALKGGRQVFRSQCREELACGDPEEQICDHYRQAGRETSFTDLEFYLTRK